VEVILAQLVKEITAVCGTLGLRFEVLTAERMKMAVFRVVAPSIIALMMEAASTSETLVNFYQTTRRTTQKTAIFKP
jgi:hypothetical protein